MRRLLIAALVAVSAGVPAVPTAAVADGWPCGVQGARLVRESRSAVMAKRVYRTGRVNIRYYGCLRTGRAVEVGVDEDLPEGGALFLREKWTRFAGRYLLVTRIGCSEGCALHGFDVFDLADGSRTRSFEARGLTEGPRRVFLTARGAVVYVIEDGDEVSLVKFDGAGHDIVARDNAERLPPASVGVRGNRLTWTLRGRARAYTLR